MEEAQGSTTARQKPTATVASTAFPPSGKGLDPDLGSQGMGGHDRSKFRYDLILNGSPDTAFHPSSLCLATLTRILLTPAKDLAARGNRVVTAFDRVRITADGVTPGSQTVEYALSSRLVRRVRPRSRRYAGLSPRDGSPCASEAADSRAYALSLSRSALRPAMP